MQSRGFDTTAVRLLAEIPVRDVLGEGILWDDAASEFVWTDIEGRRIHRLSWPDCTLQTFPAPLRIGSFALTDEPGTIIAAFETGFARFEPATGNLEWLARPEMPPGMRFNDGRVDRNGRFVAGTLVEDVDAAGDACLGKLYRLEADNSLTVLLEKLGIPNALCWSPDGRTVYHSDTLSQSLRAFDYGESLSDERVVTNAANGEGLDGGIVDKEGRIWIALWAGWRVVVLDQDGANLKYLPMPVSQPTCVALGGPDLNILAVTSASGGLSTEELAEQPRAGNLFLFEVPATGIAEHRVNSA